MEAFKELIKEITRLLKQKGFKKKGDIFYIEADKNYGIINFQKSRDSTKDVIKFTINFGIYSDVIGQAFDFAHNNLRIPDVWSCQWEARVGQFMLGSPDYWWHVNASYCKQHHS